MLSTLPQINRANSSCEMPIAFLILRTWLGVILDNPYTLAPCDFNRLWQNDVRKAALRADRAETWDRLLVDLEERV